MSIPLSQGLYAIVDGKNYERLSMHKWHAAENGKTYYAGRYIRRKSKRTTISMHREILGLCFGDGKKTDHVNHCGLDNREQNIRVCTHQQNMCNRELQSNNTSGYAGVYWYKQSKKWSAIIKNNGILNYLGLFNSKKEAIRTYEKKSVELKGEFKRKVK